MDVDAKSLNNNMLLDTALLLPMIIKMMSTGVRQLKDERTGEATSGEDTLMSLLPFSDSR